HKMETLNHYPMMRKASSLITTPTHGSTCQPSMRNSTACGLRHPINRRFGTTQIFTTKPAPLNPKRGKTSWNNSNSLTIRVTPEFLLELTLVGHLRTGSKTCIYAPQVAINTINSPTTKFPGPTTP